MKKLFSIELKIIMAATVAMLVLFTAVVASQIFKGKSDDVTFVYNSSKAETVTDINISDIFSEM